MITATDYATRAYPEAQRLLKAAPEHVLEEYLTVGWFDADFNPTAAAGCFAIVAPELEDLVGDVIGVRVSPDRVVYAVVYVSADVPEPIVLSRRTFLGLALLSMETVEAVIEVLP